MNTYEFQIKGYDAPMCAVGNTIGKARYNAYLEADELFDGFEAFLKSIESERMVGSFQVSDLFSKDTNGFKRVCEYRCIPFARIGMHVTVNGRPGTICGANDSANLNVCFDGDSFVTNCHPGYKMEFIQN